MLVQDRATRVWKVGDAMAYPGPETRKLYARYYARFGEWGQLDLILQGDPVPPDLLTAAKRLRAVYLAEEERRQLAENLGPKPKRIRVEWVTEDGEQVAVEGYEVEAT
jgi:hypothetical protein